MSYLINIFQILWNRSAAVFTCFGWFPRILFTMCVLIYADLLRFPNTIILGY